MKEADVMCTYTSLGACVFRARTFGACVLGAHILYLGRVYSGHVYSTWGICTWGMHTLLGAYGAGLSHFVGITVASLCIAQGQELMEALQGISYLFCARIF